jgi:N-ethylmaleimide reductase
VSHDAESPDLFSSFALGSLTLPNRVVMAPMTRSRADADHVPTPIMADYYTQRADAGLIITEGTGPDANGTAYARIPGIWNDAQIAGWKVVTDAVHAKGGRIAIQLMHCGRIGHPLNLAEGAELVAPSAIAAPGEMYTDQEGPKPHPVPREMTEADIEATLEGYAQAARNAIAAGFDMVELHGANGYLVDQFISPNSNTRTDAWGGDIQGRGRFALAAARRIAAAIGKDRVGIRLSPGGVFNGIVPWEGMADDFTWLAGALGELGLAFLHIVDHSAMGAPPVSGDLKQAMRAAFGGPVILVGGYDRDTADGDLAADKGELIAFGRPFISNPDLVARLRAGAELAAPDFGTFYTPGEKGYTDYPTL